MIATYSIGGRIRAELPGDADAIAAVTREAFLNAPHSSHDEEFIVAALRDAKALAVSLVTEVSGRVVGHIAFSPVAISDGSTRWYGLGPVSVGPSVQRIGIGSALVADGLARLRRVGASGCVVLGDAVFHARFGFVSVPTLVLPGDPQEYFLALSFDGPFPAGQVAYHAAFSVTRAR